MCESGRVNSHCRSRPAFSCFSRRGSLCSPCEEVGDPGRAIVHEHRRLRVPGRPHHPAGLLRVLECATGGVLTAARGVTVTGANAAQCDQL